MNEAILNEGAKALVAPTKGILAADWSPESAEKHFIHNSVENTEENRRKYRQILFTAPGIEEYISGVIMHEETFRQSDDHGKLFPQLLLERGIIPGIKVDKGTVEMENFPGEQITEGLDGLNDRLFQLRGLGAQFAKWRAVITIGDDTPTKTNFESNSEILARYAAMCQQNEIVPVVEPEVLLEGDYEIQRCRDATEAMIKILFEKLEEHRVFMEAVILKPNMVQPGKDNPKKASSEEIAAATIGVLKEVVPNTVPGIAFLSGGQSPMDATANLNAMNKMSENPWQVTFSYARALQAPVLETWQGKEENIALAQKAFLKRAKLNSLARQGKYDPEMEKE
jgi:fructose-bisphosphate aldolase class I